ncbi:hypothetical protein LPW33_13185 [Ectothiorhodospira variabilis]|uniref:hypothetical protein n=1 Tax=Ectothiorhodospira variabilis TaxID=505694 RepID=UPI001EFAE647|nr:hypothetical protein [Ectothiorhodospira variabilis]MCG5497497.1 hypothetical protein [Ectothiorhodospira variabilis]MCG5504860.1 hypothetical protein [Ectothiorhodospira variabilis]MCG5508017.1 hypothetical protein [Ectothiorhodospira variabilis]
MQTHIADGYRIAVDLDLAKFFDTVQHDILMARVGRKALGTPKRAAIWTGMSSKSYWHLSRSLGTQIGITNDWLRRQGLLSIRDPWMKAHGYA